MREQVNKLYKELIEREVSYIYEKCQESFNEATKGMKQSLLDSKGKEMFICVVPEPHEESKMLLKERYGIVLREEETNILGKVLVNAYVEC